MTKKMLIDAAQDEEIRVALIDGKKVEDFDFESSSRKPLRGNIYLARVTRVEPSLQAAFVEYGGNRHGFLAFSEIHPDYYQVPVSDRRILQDAEQEMADLAKEIEDFQRNDYDDHHGDSDASTDDHNADESSTEESRADVETASADNDDEADTSDADQPVEADQANQTSYNNSDKTGDQPVDEDDTPEDASNVTTDDEDQTPDEIAAHNGDESESAEDDGEELAASDASQEAVSEDSALPPTSMPEEDTPEVDNLLPGSDTSNASVSIALTAEGNPEISIEDVSEDNDDGDDDGDLDFDDDFDDSDVGGSSERRKKINALNEAYKEARRKHARVLRNYKIQEVVKARQILLVQVVKEERGTKGAALTSYLSLAGRYCVLMPNTARGGGISRKIPSAQDRKRLRRIVNDLDVTKGMGLIIRTAGAKRTKLEIKRDYDYLTRLWENIRELTLKSVAPCLIYEEASLIKRAIRDLYDKDISRVLVEGENGYREAKDFMKMLMPSHAKNIQPYKEETPLFLHYDVEQQLDAMYQPNVRLKSGGYLVIHQTEALIAVDVNSGKATRERNIEATALKTNLEAASEVARQCKLRDLAGLVVIDFIDMEEMKNNRAVEKRLKEALKNDRARIQTSRISSFGLLEMSRQRRRSGIVDGTTHTCPTCSGSGAVRSHEMASLRILRAIEAEAISHRSAVIAVKTSSEVALYILNYKRDWLGRIENQYALSVEITADPQKAGDLYEVERRGAARAMPVRNKAIQADYGVDDEADLTQIDDADAANEHNSHDRHEENADQDGDGGRKRKRRRRRRRGGRDHADGDRNDSEPLSSETNIRNSEDADDHDHDDQHAARAVSNDDDISNDAGDSEDKPKKRRRRGRRGGRKNRERNNANQEFGENNSEQDASEPSSETSEAPPQAEAMNPERQGPESENVGENEGANAEPEPSDKPKRKPRVKAKPTPDAAPEEQTAKKATSRPRRKTKAASPEANGEQSDTDAGSKPQETSEKEVSEAKPAAKKKKTAGKKGWWQRALGA